MRSRFDEQLHELNQKMTQMGALCEKFISICADALLEGDARGAEEILTHGHEIDEMERQIEAICLKLLLQQQPVARDLRQISAALKMITDMERIGDQAEDIAEIIPFLSGRTGQELQGFQLMAQTARSMVNGSIEAFVKSDLEMARQVLQQDDIVDECFVQVKKTLMNMISNNTADGEYAVDLLMIAKYFERIGDHATNIAEWVEFSVTGVHKGAQQS